MTKNEKSIEQALTAASKAIGGMGVKLVSPGMAGMPDRLVLLPHGRTGFVEVKAPGRKPRPLQLRRHEQLRVLGFQVHVLDSMEKVGDILKAIGGKEA